MLESLNFKFYKLNVINISNQQETPTGADPQRLHVEHPV